VQETLDFEWQSKIKLVWTS